jgi:hypothetical protein
MTAALVGLMTFAPGVRARGTAECPLPQDVKAIVLEVSWQAETPKLQLTKELSPE